MGQPRPLFCLFSFFSNTNFTEKTVGFSAIQTSIIRVEGEHGDHLTNTTALKQSLVTFCFSIGFCNSSFNFVLFTEKFHIYNFLTNISIKKVLQYYFPIAKDCVKLYGLKVHWHRSVRFQGFQRTIASEKQVGGRWQNSSTRFTLDNVDVDNE